MRVVGIAWDDYLALRTGPSTRYSKIAEIPPDGTDLDLDTCRSRWCKIHYNGYTGWASVKYLNRYSGDSSAYKHRARVSGIRQNDTLAVRTGPSTRYTRIGDLPPNAYSIEILQCKHRWCRIRYGSLEGWSSGKYLRSY